MNELRRRLQTHSWIGPAVAALLAIAAIPGVFTTSRVFYLRDLASWFWPLHLWFHHTLIEGSRPFWYPYPGCGYAIVRDPAFHTLFLPTLPLRFLPPILGFNLIVALPFPVAAIGMCLFLRRHVILEAAVLGAVVVAASGPFLSAANMPNLAWCAALIPWVLFFADGLTRRFTAARFAALSLTFALMVFAGEPVTFGATAVLASLYAWFGRASTNWARGARAAAAASGAVLVGVLLGAAQILPLIEANRSSIRASGALADIWSLHPARLVETVAPYFFGKWVGMSSEITQWVFGLNDRREPLLISLYLGVPALLLATLGAVGGRRRRFRLFFTLAVPVCLLIAIGSYDPLYAAARAAIPALTSVRFASKLMLVGTVAIGALAAGGLDALARARSISGKTLSWCLGLAALLVVAAATATIVGSRSPQSALSMGQTLAAHWSLPDPAAAARSLLGRMVDAGPRLLIVAVAGAALLLFSRAGGRKARVAYVGLIALVVCDLVAANASINPTVDAKALAPFGWVDKTAQHPEDRVFVSGTLGVGLPRLDDAPPPAVYPADVPPALYQALYDAVLGNYWSGWNIRKTLSADLTGLRPHAYLNLLRRFTESDRAARYRFLSWIGTRYFLVASPPPMRASELLRLPNLGTTALYESEPTGARALIVTEAEIQPDEDTRIARLFDPSFDTAKTVLLESPPPNAMGIEGQTQKLGAKIVEDSPTSVTIEAAAPVPSYLLLLDAYDPGWSVQVDESWAPLLRADGIFRAVRVTSGQHRVRFVFRPRSLRIGTGISLVTALGLLVFVLVRSNADDVRRGVRRG